MKTLLASLSFIFVSQLTFANAIGPVGNEVKCTAHAIEIAKKLDLIFSEVNGPFQGDFDTDELPVAAVLNSEKLLKSELKDYQDLEQNFSITIGHTNEDNEQWTNIYNVTVLKTVFKQKDVYCTNVLGFSFERTIVKE